MRISKMYCYDLQLVDLNNDSMNYIKNDMQISLYSVSSFDDTFVLNEKSYIAFFACMKSIFLSFSLKNIL